MEQKYAEYAAQKAVELLAIDSPTGFTDRAAAWVQDAFGALGNGFFRCSYAASIENIQTALARIADSVGAQ